MTLKELFTTNMKWNADSWILVNDIFRKYVIQWRSTGFYNKIWFI